MIGMSFWFGGLAYLLTGLRVLRKLDAPLGTGLTALVAKQFSAMAIASVGVVGLTGLYAASLRVGSIQALFTTLYGSALLIKQGFVALLLLLAGTNLLVIGPRLERARAAGTSGMAVAGTFGKMVLAESVLACLLLLSVSLLSYLPPARIIPRTSEIIRTADVDDLGAHLAIAPGYVGQNTFTVHLTSDGEPLESAKEVLLRFTPAQDNIPPSEIQLLGRGNGEFVAKGSNLSLPGEWQVQLVVRREKKFDTFANFDLSLAGAGGDAASQAIPRFSGAMLLLDGLLIAVAVFAMRGRPGVRIGTGAILGLALVSVGVFALTHLPTRPLSQANPIVPSAESVAAGKAIYDVRCGPCHGVAGKGDGPLGLALNPRPADLTLHAIPGVHTDAQLFDWITNGFPGSAMPAFRSMLSDTDRWNLVNFIRTFAPK
jgi:copper transport protein